jgi:hypothetical protein
MKIASKFLEARRQQAQKTLEELNENIGRARSKIQGRITTPARNTMLASIGAVALAGDQLEGLGEHIGALGDKCLERGKSVEDTARTQARTRLDSLRALFTRTRDAQASDEAPDEAAADVTEESGAGGCGEPLLATAAAIDETMEADARCEPQLATTATIDEAA